MYRTPTAMFVLYHIIRGKYSCDVQWCSLCLEVLYFVIGCKETISFFSAPFPPFHSF